jgi:hypothetical protein
MSRSSLLKRFTWSLSLIIMLCGFVVIALAHGVTTEGHWTRLFLTEVGIAGASAGIVGFVYEHLLRRELLDQVKAELAEVVDTDAKRLGMVEIYESRTKKAERVKLPLLIRDARTEIMFVGLGLYTIINEYRTYLEEALARGCAVKFLVFNFPGPSAKLLNDSLSAGDLTDNLTGAFNTALAFTAKHRSSGKVALRLFDVVPTFGSIAIDRGEGDGFLLIELNCYSSAGDQCPGFKLEKKPNGLFYNYDRQITALWQNATVFDPEPVAGDGRGSQA